MAVLLNQGLELFHGFLRRPADIGYVVRAADTDDIGQFVDAALHGGLHALGVGDQRYRADAVRLQRIPHSGHNLLGVGHLGDALGLTKETTSSRLKPASASFLIIATLPSKGMNLELLEAVSGADFDQLNAFR